VFGVAEQVNLPATTDDVYPNWRRKITVDLDDWDADGRFAAIAATIRAQGRGRAT
jgi:(1->4)-alpha-D-glucan 1-alpha-D-glucosylmutase